MILMFLGAGLCGVAAALSMDSPRYLMLALAGIGLFSAIYHPIGPRYDFQGGESAYHGNGLQRDVWRPGARYGSFGYRARLSGFTVRRLRLWFWPA